MVRYLMFFSYIGTKFCGSQRQTDYSMVSSRISTVQDVIESGLAMLRPKSQPKLVGSSRTDTGVHSFCSSGHVDLTHFTPGKYYKPDVVTYAVNMFLAEMEHPVRILRTVMVPDDFHCRHMALHRTYVYRIAVVKKDILPGVQEVSWPSKVSSLIPLAELNACNIIPPPFDIEALRRGCMLFRGTHNFTSFMKKPSHRDKKAPRNPVRNMEVCEVTPGRGLFSEYAPFHDHLEHWNITFRSSGFLQRQVRRMVGALVALAAGKITEEDVKFLLDNPSHESWAAKNIGHTPPHGLHLVKVAYDEKDFTLPVDYFDVIQRNKCSYNNQKHFVFHGLLNALTRRTEQLAEAPPLSTKVGQAV